MPKGTENLWNKNDVAEFLGYKPKTIEKWVADGLIKCCRNAPGSELRFDPEYIRSFGGVDFKNRESSPEIKRMKRYYERKIEVRDRKISILENKLRNVLIQATQGINETNEMDEENILSIV